MSIFGDFKEVANSAKIKPTQKIPMYGIIPTGDLPEQYVYILVLLDFLCSSTDDKIITVYIQTSVTTVITTGTWKN